MPSCWRSKLNHWCVVRSSCSGRAEQSCPVWSGPCGRDRPGGFALGGRVMAAKITTEVVENHLRCKYKARLKLAGEQGRRSDYESILATSREQVRLRAVVKLLQRHGADGVAQAVTLSAS